MTTALQEAVAKLVARKKLSAQGLQYTRLNAEIERSVMSRALKPEAVVLLRAYARLMVLYQELTGKAWTQGQAAFFRPPPAHPLDDLSVDSRLDHYAQRNTRPISWSPARALEWAMFQASGVKLDRGEAEQMLADVKAARARREAG
jgi:hypothetical protein